MKLDPKQKKVLLAVAAVVVVLFALMSRRTGGGTGSVDPTASTPADGALPSTFADNGAGFGQLSTSISEGLGSVGLGMETLADSVARAGEDDARRWESIDAGIAGLAGRMTTLETGAAASPSQQPPAQAARTGRPERPAYVSGPAVVRTSPGGTSKTPKGKQKIGTVVQTTTGLPGLKPTTVKHKPAPPKPKPTHKKKKK